MTDDALTIPVDNLQEILRWVVLSLAQSALRNGRVPPIADFFPGISHVLDAHWDTSRSDYLQTTHEALEKVASGALSLDEIVSLAGDTPPPSLSLFDKDPDLQAQVGELRDTQHLRISPRGLAIAMRWAFIVLAHFHQESPQTDLRDLVAALTTNPTPEILSQLRESSLCGIAVQRGVSHSFLDSFCASLSCGRPHNDGD